MIEVKNLIKKYGNQLALNNVSLLFPSRGVIGLLGENGAGKSTLMKILNGSLIPDTGVVLFDDHNIYKERKNIMNKIGYLPEDNPIYPDLYVLEYLTFFAEMYSVKKYRERISEVVEIVGLRKELHKKAGELSKGYKQRLGLATAILHDPEFLILDEPTNGFDPKQIVEIRALIKKLGESKLILISTHILQEAEAMCDEIIVLEKGKILQFNTLKKLKSVKNNFFVELVLKDIPSSFEFFLHPDILDFEVLSDKIILQGRNESLPEIIFNIAVKEKLNVLELKVIESGLKQLFD